MDKNGIIEEMLDCCEGCEHFHVPEDSELIDYYYCSYYEKYLKPENDDLWKNCDMWEILIDLERKEQ
ncbi:MAG: hypothetical protein QXG16_04795 [Candidatus Anstonellaceae archaeon]